MKRFNHDAAMDKVMAERGAFFAFSNSQLDAAKAHGIEYVSLGHGLIAPKDQAASLVDDFQRIHDEKIAWELANNTRKDIIWYELGNHECQIAGGWQTIVELLEPYGITADEIKAEWPAYFDHCVKHDYF
jgi:hypothetical protein